MWALHNVSFQVRQGEALGIVGHNGAGKTTILKILSSITTPTSGEITVRGRMAALVEVGSGFHPELTGRENINLHGAMLGMRRSEIRQKLDSIIEFSGVGQYIDVPVKRYSSGMYVRLGFSIAAHLNPDILLLDEVLAVGDAAFQAKCLDRLAELRRTGRTVVFISHDLAAVYRLCDRAILMDHGRVVADGPPRQVIDEYQRMTFGDDTASLGAAESESPARCTSVSFSAPDSAQDIRTGYPMVARLSYRANQIIPAAVFRISLYWPSGYLCAQLTTDSSQGGFSLGPGEGRIEFHCPVVPVVPGLYRVDISIESNGREIDLRQRCATLNVGLGKFVSGDFYIESLWKLIEGSLPEEQTFR
ncbi:MAG TPA: polysaccharide ABC transporter ATP-binding protein [Candidatus Acidoferrales bacterium]|jgi:ABC-type polysaccharide/polyol phosphate transport system ATPase subunit|nr:polysaccharide ABC transporter ATP-binding protein [Candidatus Acidoferrales bacterium]